MEVQENYASQKKITPKKWALYGFVASIPLIGLIMLLVWGFGNDGNETRKNWAQGMLLLYLILIIVNILFFFVIGGTALLGSLGSSEF
ncbi:hypothetical protein [Mesonia aquimarina]|uniref:hypothetical protein n=1 Tax=Mesonia aquimarina TaxID=1504967 RepID=UPI000EF5A22B|nr:hypothetical protein [Mesonia aquimarina]